MGGGGGGASKVFYGRCANGEFNGESTPQTKLNLWFKSAFEPAPKSLFWYLRASLICKKAIANLSNKLKRNAFPVNC